jgi:hypothetical protein
VNIRVLSMVLRVLFVVQLILGIFFWFGAAEGLVGIHMLIGICFVAVFWLIGVAYALRGGSLTFVLGTFVLGLILALYGMFQTRLLTGSGHWIVQVVHLLLAVLAIGVAEMIAGRAQRTQAA